MVRSLLLLLLAAPAWAGRPDVTPELDAERDQLIDKIARGVEVEASVKRFKALVAARDQRVATSHTAVEHERQERESRRAWREAYHRTDDYEVSWRCTLASDPANPPPSNEGRYRGDWGRVVKKEQLKLAPKNELDEGEPATLYEVAGIHRSYFIRGERFGAHHREDFVAEKGELVLVCDGGTDHDKRLPAPWSEAPLEHSGFAVKIESPPLIIKKAKWNPIHITASGFSRAIREVKWPYPIDSFVLSNIEIGDDLGQGRWKIEAQGSDWVLEVPPSLARRELLAPGRALWAIVGQPRFDKGLKKLVLVAVDLEARYVTEEKQ